jgi:hypothetical protein
MIKQRRWEYLVTLIKRPWISMLKFLNQIEIIVNYSSIISVFALSVWNIVNYLIELKKYKFLLVENVNLMDEKP